MKKMRKTLSVLLTIVILFSLCNTVFAVGAIEEDYYYCGDEHAKELVCGKTEDLVCTVAEHTHGVDCVAHVHTEECMTLTVDSTKCTAEEHTHTAECAHQHTDACKELTCTIATDVCGLTACTQEVHEHSDACQGTDCIEVHEHTAECPQKVCAVVEHTHGDDCHTHADGSCSFHAHTDACFELTCGKTDADMECGKVEHTHTDACMTSVVDPTKCTKEWECESEEHAHAVECYSHKHNAMCYKCVEPDCTKYIPKDLETVTFEESGIDFNLYNFSGEINLEKPYAEGGKVFTPLSQYFNFNGANPDSYWTSTKDPGNLIDGHLTYEKNLGEDGAPVIAWDSVGNMADLESTESRSLGYVFGKDEHFAVSVYEDILNTPLVYNPETGYYEYDSSKNAVDFDLDGNMIYVRGYLEQGDASADANNKFAADDGLADFFPFNSRIEEDENGNIIGFVENSESYKKGDTYYQYDRDKNTDLAHPDYWFGASMKADFYYPKDGMYNGEVMKYQFSGDDDVSVYIDGIFALDLAGAHSRASGEIDFATGLIETWMDAGNQTIADGKNKNPVNPANNSYDHKEWAADAFAAGTLEKVDGVYYDTREAEGLQIRYSTTTLYDSYKAAYLEKGMTEEEIESKLAEVFVPVYDQATGEQNTVLDAYGNEHLVYRFRDDSKHTFDWFYLERHSWEANFYTKFNLPTLQPGEEVPPSIVIPDPEDPTAPPVIIVPDPEDPYAPPVIFVPDDFDEEILENIIPEELIPLSNEPEDYEEPDDDEIVILDEEIPLAEVPETGDASDIMMLVAILAVIGLIAVNLPAKKRYNA